jgi:hypothetical protein
MVGVGKGSTQEGVVGEMAEEVAEASRGGGLVGGKGRRFRVIISRLLKEIRSGSICRQVMLLLPLLHPTS